MQDAIIIVNDTMGARALSRQIILNRLQRASIPVCLESLVVSRSDPYSLYTKGQSSPLPGG